MADVLIPPEKFGALFERALADRRFRQELLKDPFRTIERHGADVSGMPPEIRDQLAKIVAKAQDDDGDGAKCGTCGVCGACTLCGEADVLAGAAALAALAALGFQAKAPVVGPVIAQK